MLRIRLQTIKYALKIAIRVLDAWSSSPPTTEKNVTGSSFSYLGQHLMDMSVDFP